MNNRFQITVVFWVWNCDVHLYYRYTRPNLTLFWLLVLLFWELFIDFSDPIDFKIDLGSWDKMAASSI